MFDLVVRGGRVVDGTGAPAVTADVAIRDGAIVEVAPRIDGEARETIDAAGTKLATIVMPQTPLDIRWMGLLDCPMRQSTLMGRTELVKRHLDLPAGEGEEIEEEGAVGVPPDVGFSDRQAAHRRGRAKEGAVTAVRGRADCAPPRARWSWLRDAIPSFV